MCGHELGLGQTRHAGTTLALARARRCFFNEKLLRGGEIEIAIYEGAYMHQCICMYMLETLEKLPHDIVESVADIWNRKNRHIAV